ncbi:EAL domain-containing protein [Salirhabdus sp. Marseille-P4669]|uniref:EAL domain-containing protein n=1 Tax=Salirhabdus sp. Marseille-P4669 TaxID=2042310 RepID=UPI000C7AC961|nr:EAL domain-containing protein [Salirhabdus sp. Marseille-P4669]
MPEKKVKKLIEEQYFYHVFQPIYKLDSKELFGYEALFRTELFDNPELAFRAAKQTDMLFSLEFNSLQKAIVTFAKASPKHKEGKLFLNVFPSTLADESFSNFLSKLLLDNKIDKNQIVLEINEAEVIHDTISLKSSILELKQQGYAIAIDDVGKGAASLVAIIELDPDIIKMDCYFSKDLSLSEPKQEMIKSVLTYCNNTEIALILEGIEESQDYELAKQLEVPNAQGYYLGKPSALSEIDFTL